MRHPVFANKGIIRAFGLVALILIAIDSLILYYSFHASMLSATINASVYSIGILLLALPLWYPVFYLDKSKGVINNTIQFASTGAIFIAIWYMICRSVIFSIEYSFKIDLKIDPGYTLIRLLTGCFIFLSFLSIYYVLIYSDNLQEQKQKQNNLAKLLKETELSVLKSQLNPHFLFNSLNSISSLTITNPNAARKMITELSDFLRYSLRNNKELLSFEEELNNVLRYIEIEKIRFGDKINFTTDIQEQCLQKKLPALILQPLIENAIKHGVYEAMEPVLIKIISRVHKGDLRITIENEYESESIMHKGEGIGLKNITNRLRNIYDKNDLVNIQQTERLYKVKLTFPQIIE